MKVTLHLEMELNDLIIIVQLASRERVNVEQFVQKCIQEYIDRHYSTVQAQSQRGEKKNADKKDT